jgi:LPXTG-motif cell wall-anchored protein
MLGAAAIAGGVALVGLGTTAGAVTAPFPAGTTTFVTSSKVTLGSMAPLTITGRMTGTSDGKGNITFPASGIHIDPSSIHVTTPITLTIGLTTVADGPFKSTIDTSTGVVTLNGSVTQTLNVLAGSTDCKLAGIVQNFKSNTTGGKAYTPTGTTATAAVAGSIKLPGVTAGPGGCALASAIQMQLPSSGTVVETLNIFPPGVKPPPPPTSTSTTTSTVPVKASSTTVTAGGQITLSGNGWKAGSTVTLTLNSTPVALGTATVDASGAFTKTVTIPADTAAGTHTITVSGTDPAGAPRTVSVTITVSAAATTAAPAASTLPRTGSSSMPITLAGLALLVLGALLVLQGRRRVNATR